MPKSFVIGEVSTVIRRKLSLNKEQCVFLLVKDGKELLKSNSLLEDVYEQYKDKDGFLYILYTNENTLG